MTTRTRGALFFKQPQQLNALVGGYPPLTPRIRFLSVKFIGHLVYLNKSVSVPPPSATVVGATQISA